MWLVVAALLAVGLSDLPDKYRRWLDEEVVYIISAREREEFLLLSADAAREAFRERFWLARDTDSSTDEVEYRAEHYRRIRYANEKFHDGKPGWRTERGRIYIMHGPPDSFSFTFGGNPLGIDVEGPTEVITGDSNPDRRRTFRLSFTTPESEIWLYRKLAGAENHTGYFQVIFARIDPNQVYHLNQTMRHLGSGGALSYPQRLERDYAIMNFFRSQRVGGAYQILYTGEYKFQDVDDLYQSVFHPRRLPSISVTDLQLGLQDLERSPGEVLERKLAVGRRLKQQVGSRIFFKTFPLALQYGSLRSESGATLLPLTFGVFLDSAGEDTLDLLVELNRADGQSVASVVDSIRLPAAANSASEGFLYQTRLAARPGKYQLNVYGTLRKRVAVAHLTKEVELPDYKSSVLMMSDVLLFQKVVPRQSVAASARPDSSLQFVGGSRPLYTRDYALVPASDNRFRRRENLTAFVEVYNPGQSEGEKSANLRLRCRFRQQGLVLAEVPDKQLQYITETGASDSDVRRTLYGLSIPLRSFPPGDYSVELEVFDQVSKQNVSRQTSFTIY